MPHFYVGAGDLNLNKHSYPLIISPIPSMNILDGETRFQDFRKSQDNAVTLEHEHAILWNPCPYFSSLMQGDWVQFLFSEPGQYSEFVSWQEGGLSSSQAGGMDDSEERFVIQAENSSKATWQSSVRKRKTSLSCQCGELKNPLPDLLSLSLRVQVLYFLWSPAQQLLPSQRLSYHWVDATACFIYTYMHMLGELVCASYMHL